MRLGGSYGDRGRGMLDLKPVNGGEITPRGTGGGVTAWQVTGVGCRSFLWRGNN